MISNKDEVRYILKWGVYVANNADNNDIAYKALVKIIYLDKDKRGRRGHCFSYIVNIAAKAFIYSKKHKAFINEAN